MASVQTLYNGGLIPKSKTGRPQRVVLGCLLWALGWFPPAAPATAQAPPQAATEGALHEITSRLAKLASPEPNALARALDAEWAGKGEPEAPARLLLELGDLDADGVSEYALEWPLATASGTQAGATGSPPVQWLLALLSWDGAHWRASRLLAGAEAFHVEVLPASSANGPRLAVEITSMDEPYPVVFAVRAHSAVLLWDSRSDESRYQANAQGRIEYRMAGATLEMRVIGRADPGLIEFPREGRRGFDVRELYRWDGHAFIPVKSEYQINPDFVLYRFISALHLHDYRTAYALVDPAKFLAADPPSLEQFQEKVQDTWPEFLDDKIFAASESAEGYDFQLQLEDGKTYVYHPAFVFQPEIRLTSLERKEE